MIELIPFEPLHLTFLENVRNEADCFATMPLREYAAKLATVGPAFSGYDGVRLLGCAGIGILWPGVGEAWLCCSREVEQHKIEFHKLMLKSMVVMISSYKLHRLQCSVALDAPAVWKRWLKLLGFQYEGMMRAYGSNREHYERWAKITKRVVPANNENPVGPGYVPADSRVRPAGRPY